MPPTPDDGDDVAGADLGGVDRRPPPGDHATAQQAGPVERDVLLDLDAAGLVDDRVVGEGAEHAHQTQILTLGVMARGAAGDLHAGAHQGTEVAQVGVASGTGVAATAGRDEAEHDVVAGLEPGHAGADRLDDACTLVPTDDGQLEGEVAGDQVLVGVAHARRRELDEDLTLLGDRRVRCPRRSTACWSPRESLPWSACSRPYGK
jgi:hypothetical protein